MAIMWPGGRTSIFLLCLFTIMILASCAVVPRGQTTQPGSSSSKSIPVYTYKIIHTYPHDRDAFTEGLVFDNGFLYEGTGLYGRSTLRKVDLASGNILQNYQLPAEYFGEGITIYNNSIIQLTWQSHTGLVYDQNTFDLRRQFSYSTEGWGLTYDGKRLVLSDGTSIIHFLDPETFKSIGEIEVKDGGTSTDNINELEFIQGKIYANIWQSNQIAIIDPGDGHISAWANLSGLLQTQNFTGAVDVLNGIAYDKLTDRLFVTGKLWPFLFEIQLVPQ